MLTASANGGADIWGSISQAVIAKDQEKINAVVANVVEQAAENTRASQGKTKLQFYGGFVLEWAKKYWLKLLLAVVSIVVLVKLLRRAFRGKKSKKSW